MLGGRLVVEALELAACGGLRPVKQPQAGVTYASKIEKAEAAIDWSQPAEVIARRIRAFDPSPGASSVLGGETLKLWSAQAIGGAVDAPAPAGTILAVSPAAVDVRCGQGVLRLTQLQRAGGKRLAVADFLRGFDMQPGMTFESPS